MDNWHQQHLNELIKIIENEFTFIYQKYKSKNNTIYAYALKANDKVIITRSVVSTFEMLKKEHYGLKWEAQLWGGTLNDGDVEDNLDQFNKKMVERYWTDIGPKIQKGHDSEVEIENNLIFYMDALKQAKKVLVHKFGEEVENILFFISVRYKPESEIRSAIEMNAASKLLDDFLENKKYRNNE